MNCLNCGSETDNPKFCSRSCAATFNNKAKGIRSCKICCNPVKSYRHDLCEQHHYEAKDLKFKSRTLAEYRNLASVKGKHPSWINSHVRRFARSWNKDLTEKPCEHCGYTLHVELAHIKAVSSFDESATLGEVNSKDNLKALCPNCHWEFDNLPRQ